MYDTIDDVIDKLTEDELNNLQSVLNDLNITSNHDSKEIEIKTKSNKLELTGYQDTNNLIFNELNIGDLIALSLTNKALNTELHDILLKCQITILCAKTLTEIINKNDENREIAEHLLIEMYYEMKKSQNK